MHRCPERGPRARPGEVPRGSPALPSTSTRGTMISNRITSAAMAVRYIEDLALRAKATEALEAGSSDVTLYTEGDATTLVFQERAKEPTEEGQPPPMLWRAAQTTGDGVLSTGAWEVMTQTILLDTQGEGGEALRVDLSGGLVTPDGAPIPA